MGLAKDIKERREATFALIDQGADAFFMERDKLFRRVTMGRQTWTGVLRSAGYDPNTWAEIERVLTAIGFKLAERTNDENKKFWGV